MGANTFGNVEVMFSQHGSRTYLRGPGVTILYWLITPEGRLRLSVCCSDDYPREGRLRLCVDWSGGYPWEGKLRFCVI